jgi:hypothetical protein
MSRDLALLLVERGVRGGVQHRGGGGGADGESVHRLFKLLLFLNVHLLFVDDLSLELRQQVQQWLSITCIANERVLEQFLGRGPSVGIFY